MAEEGEAASIAGGGDEAAGLKHRGCGKPGGLRDRSRALQREEETDGGYSKDGGPPDEAARAR